MITIDLVNQKYKINDPFRVQYASRPNSPQYSHANAFVIGNHGPWDSQAEGPQNEYSCITENPELNNPRFGIALIIWARRVNH